MLYLFNFPNVAIIQFLYFGHLKFGIQLFNSLVTPSVAWATLCPEQNLGNMVILLFQ